jgi:hypothetical protein
VVESEEGITEPVTLPEQKAYSQIDEEYAVKDAQLTLFITAARQLLEAQTNLGFVNRNITLQWDGGLIDMPLSPTGTIASVTDKDGNVLTSDEYSVGKYQAKKISVNSVSTAGYHYFYSRSGYVEITREQGYSLEDEPFYSCLYNTGYDVLPSDLKTAVMAQADYMLKQLGMPDRDPNQISPVALMLIRSRSRNLVL